MSACFPQGVITTVSLHVYIATMGCPSAPLAWDIMVSTTHRDIVQNGIERHLCKTMTHKMNNSTGTTNKQN